jgi:hypothetical protein
MITFIRVQGPVAIDDKKARQTMDAVNGMRMPSAGIDCIIAAGAKGRATLTIGDAIVELRERQFLRIRPDGRSYRQKHNERWGPGKWKLFFGRLWAIARREIGTEREEITRAGGANVAVGVRG